MIKKYSVTPRAYRFVAWYWEPIENNHKSTVAFSKPFIIPHVWLAMMVFNPSF